MTQPEDRTLYDVAREVTDEVLGLGTYAALNEHHPDPRVQAAIARTFPPCQDISRAGRRGEPT